MNKLAKYIIISAIAVIVCYLLWYFRSIVGYILIAAILSLMGKPLVKLLKNIRIKKFKFPNWLAALLTLIVIFGVFALIFVFIVPLIGTIFQEVKSLNFEEIGHQIAAPLTNINEGLVELFPTLGEGFRLEIYLLDYLKTLFDISLFSNIFNSLASFIVNFGIGLFAVAFITYFFLLENNMFNSIILTLVPEKFEKNVERALRSVNNLLVRYFLGISVETILITIMNTIGLHFIGGLSFSLSVVLAFISGVLNVIPYIGPIVGGAIGVLLGVVTHYSLVSMPLGVFALVLIAIYVATHMVDVFLFQPYIYSNSVKAHPLEIFIVILVAGHIGGVLGMLVAIPSYTVIRVFAAEFLSKFRIVQALTKNIKEV